jgi:hypothetical protein
MPWNISLRSCTNVCFLSFSFVVAEQNALANSLTTTTAQPAGDSSAASSDAAAGLGIVVYAAAGAGVVVLIVIVVVVVVVRKRSSTPRTKAKADSSQRTVVAFENPMYDSSPKPNDSQGQDNGEGLYDNNGDNAGLYDEPAFAAKSDKENPLYESTENLGQQSGMVVEGQTYGSPEGGDMYDNQQGGDLYDNGFQPGAENDAGYLDVAD